MFAAVTRAWAAAATLGDPRRNAHNVMLSAVLSDWPLHCAGYARRRCNNDAAAWIARYIGARCAEFQLDIFVSGKFHTAITQRAVCIRLFMMFRTGDVRLNV